MFSYIMGQTGQNQRRHMFFHVHKVVAPVGRPVWSRSPGGDTGGEVCCLILHLVSLDSQLYQAISSTNFT